MKIEIVKLIIDNIEKLNPLDFIIIFTLFLFLVVDCFLFFRLIYKEVIKALSKRVEVQEDIISNLEKKSKLLQEEKELIANKMQLLSEYSAFLKEELDKKHYEKTKVEENYNRLLKNAFTLHFILFSMSFAKTMLSMIELDRAIVTIYMELANRGMIQKDEKAISYLVKLGDIGQKIIDAMSTVDPVVAFSPIEALPKLITTTVPVPELIKFDFKSARKELTEIHEGIVKPYIQALLGYAEST